MTQSPTYTTIPGRGLIKISGTDRYDFLQGLITNDINKVKSQPSLYACLLSPQGKFLHDFFITKHDEELWLECEGGERAEDLLKRLRMFKLRADVNFEIENNISIYANTGNLGYPDPRHPDMGNRTFEKPDTLPETPFEDWDKRRIKLTIPDGSRDLQINSSTMDEARMDSLNAIDYKKGCYIGQELTARMHYRGLGKKHLYTIQGENLPAPFTSIEHKGKTIGEMRSSTGKLGIALLKDTEIENIPAEKFIILK